MPTRVSGKTDEEKGEAYEEYLQEFDVKQAEYNFKKTRAKEALVVAADYGVQTGETLLVYIPELEPEAISREEKIAEEIAMLQEEKKEQIEEANEHFLNDLANELMHSGNAYWHNEKPLELKDTLAIFQLMVDDDGDMVETEVLAAMRAEWGKGQEVKTEEMLAHMLISNTGFAYKWLRRFVVHKLVAALDYKADAAGLSLRLLAERYLPQKLADLQKLYKGKQKEIIDSTNEKIAALQQTAISIVDEDDLILTKVDKDEIMAAVEKSFAIPSA